MERLDQNGWQRVANAWSLQCDGFEESFEDYASASIPVLRDFAEAEAEFNANAGVYAATKGEEYLAICQANSTLLPGYTGKVLRIRHIVLAPKFDFSEEVTLREYERALVTVFHGALHVADYDMPSHHIKFHLRSRAEREFASAFTEALRGYDQFTLAEMRGAWIYLSRTPV